MRRSILIVGLIAATVIFTCAQCKGSDKPSIRKSLRTYTEKLDSTPDLTQSDPNGKLPDGGKQCCAPVTVSNSFVWLADNGFGNLMPALPNREKAQFEIARLLGTKGYMNTSLEGGTGAGGVLEGVSRYIKDKGYEYRYLKFQGWRKHPRQFSSKVSVPKLNWIKRGLIGNSAVWLNVGWYKYNSSNDEYHRIGGHWVTLVGYGIDQDSKEDPNILIIHDPALRAGKNFSHEYVRLKMIKRGKLTGETSGLPRRAAGYYILTGGMHVRKTADFAILDGVVVLKMKKVVKKRG